MQEAKSIILSICISLICIGLITKIMPTGRFNNSIKNIISLIVILIIVTPFYKNNINIDFSINKSTNSNQADYIDYTENLTLQVLKNNITTRLEEENIQVYFLDVLLKNGKIDCIKISASDNKKAKNIIENEFKIKVG